MSAEALLLVRDPEALRIFRKALESGGISPHIVSAAGDAAVSLSSHKYDAVVIDCDDLPEGREILRTLRSGRANKNAIVFALTNGATTVKAAYELGANFVLEKPLSLDRLQRSVRAAQGLIMRERRRYFRHPLDCPGTITAADGRQLAVRVLNLSEGGMALVVLDAVPLSGNIKFKFHLLDVRTPIEGRGEVAWVLNSKEVGIKFLSFSMQSKSSFDDWLMSRIEEHEQSSSMNAPAGSATR